MFKALKVLRIFTNILFLIVLVLAYAYVPIRMDLQLPEVAVISRSQFFYGAVLIFLLVGIMSRFVYKYTDRRVYKHPVRVSAHFLPSVLNLMLILLVGYMGILNNNQGIASSNYNYISYVAIGILGLWIIGFFYSLVTRT